MQSRFLFALAILLAPFTALCQTDSSATRPAYFLSLHSGGLIGSKGFGTGFTSSLIQGVRYRRFGFGVGIGHDAYSDFQTVPLFLHLNYDFVRYRGNSIFVQMNAGFAEAWNPKVQAYPFLHYERDNEFFNPLIGYRINGDKFNLHLSMGYKYQAIEYSWSWDGRAKTNVHQVMDRVVLQIGFGFR